jgi:hypothetical protein
MRLFDKLSKPILLKTSDNTQRQLEQLQSINREALSDDDKSKLDRDIKLISWGIQGEKAIEFELRNSHIPMYILHDLYIKDEDLSAQIDYLVITHNHIFVLECKNMYGDIEINSKGDFIRTIKYGNRKQQEGIYSPITQNKRHLELLKKLRKQTKSSMIMKKLFENDFADTYRSVIVLANPRTILNDQYAPSMLKEQVIRADALIAYIKNANGKHIRISDKKMKQLADFYQDLHVENDTNYMAKYNLHSTSHKTQERIKEIEREIAATTSSNPTLCPKCNSELVLRKARKGKNEGKEFWGCSKFPKCMYTLNVDV